MSFRIPFSIGLLANSYFQLVWKYILHLFLKYFHYVWNLESLDVDFFLFINLIEFMIWCFSLDLETSQFLHLLALPSDLPFLLEPWVHVCWKSLCLSYFSVSHSHCLSVLHLVIFLIFFSDVSNLLSNLWIRISFSIIIFFTYRHSICLLYVLGCSNKFLIFHTYFQVCLLFPSMY